ncbi:MAG: TetR/AcrR family transcriptional regulator [Anaerolineales bacterium]|nr:TetR/AcrR family transcriptional regulator [Anaerolineales bacterium]
MEEARPGRVGKQYILEVAEQLFTDRGYKSTSIRDIAQASGVTNAAIYYHFPDKEALFDEVMELHARRIGACMAQAIDGTGAPRERIRAILLRIVHLLASQQSPYFMLRRDPPEFKRRQGHAHFGKIMKAFFAPLEQALEDAIRAGELNGVFNPPEAAAIVVGMLHGLYQRRQALTDSVTLSEEDIDLLVDIILKGFAKD